MKSLMFVLTAILVTSCIIPTYPNQASHPEVTIERDTEKEEYTLIVDTDAIAEAVVREMNSMVSEPAYYPTTLESLRDADIVLGTLDMTVSRDSLYMYDKVLKKVIGRKEYRKYVKLAKRQEKKTSSKKRYNRL